MRIVVIGGTGHVGTYLIPRLVEMGYEVVCVSRAQRKPYQNHGAWAAVTMATIDRRAEEQAGTFGRRIADLKPDAVIDMICYTPESCAQLVEALRGKVRHYLHCGTLWVHGHSEVVPTTEDRPRRPIDEYGKQKAAIEDYLMGLARRDGSGSGGGGFPATVLHPGHIVGCGWLPINPAGHIDPAVFTALARGEELTLPNLGMEMLHHVHADDVAQGFVCALTHWSAAMGESFHIVSPAALTMRGYAEAVAAWFGKQANLRFLPFDQWAKTVDAKQVEITEGHVLHSPCASIAKAQQTIGYRPRYTSLQATYESVMWAIAHGLLKV